MLSLLLTIAPALLLAALLLAGRFVGEERILRRWPRATKARRRAAQQSRRPRPVAVVSRIALVPLSGRGPPLGRLAPTS